MKLICPFCGTIQEPDPVRADSRVETISCSTCGQEFDIPARLDEIPSTVDETGPVPPPEPPPQGPERISPAGYKPPSPPPDYQTSAETAPDRQIYIPPPIELLPPAWEEEQSDSLFISRLWKTIWQVMLHPTRFFHSPATPGMAHALSFGVILGTLGNAVTSFYATTMDIGELATPLGGLWDILLSPVYALLGIFITAGVMHVLLLIVRGAGKGFTASFRVIAYAQAVNILAVIPFAGELFGALWGLVVMIAGLAAAHRKSAWKPVLALLVLLVLGIIITIAGAFAVGFQAFVEMMNSGAFQSM